MEVGILFCLCAKGFPTHPPIDDDNLDVMPIWPNDTIDRS